MMDHLKEIIKRIVEEAAPDKIILFGSRAKDKYKKWSDYNIYVLKKNIKNKREFEERIYYKLFGVGAAVDVIVEATEKFDNLEYKWFLIYSEIAKSGRIDPVPDEPLPPKETLGFRFQRYGILKWGDLFNSRQKLALITFVEKVRQADERIRRSDFGFQEGNEKANPESLIPNPDEYAKAVVSYLGLGINRLADKNSSLCRLIPQTEAIGFTYGRQALPMLWDYIEMNAIQHPSSWISIMEETLENLSHFTQIPPVQVEEDENG